MAFDWYDYELRELTKIIEYDDMRQQELNMAWKKLEDQGFHYDPILRKWFNTPKPEIGQKMVRITKHSRSTSSIRQGDIVEIASIYGSSSTGNTAYDERGAYHVIYQFQVKIKGHSPVYNIDNFKPVQENNVLQLETNRPTFVREFIEVTKDGKAEREYVGDWLSFDSLSAARIYCSNAISDSIRGSNTYRKFSILVGNSVAQAKKPEIEFA